MTPRSRALTLIAAIALLVNGCAVADAIRQLDTAARSSDEELLSGDFEPESQGTPPPITGLDEGLAELQSYRAVLQLEMLPGPNAPPTEAITIVQEVIRPQQKLHYSMESRGDPVTAGLVEYFQDGTDFYLLTASGGRQPDCERMTSEQTSFLDSVRGLTPEEIFGPIIPDRLVTSGEIVNGIATNRYTVNQAAMGLGEAAGSEGEVWVAREGGYIVRFAGEAEGMLGGLSAGNASQRGASRWVYDLQQVDSLENVRLAAACLAAKIEAERIPIHTSATELSTFAGVTTYRSPEPLATLADYYRGELAGAGWLVEERMAFDSLVILDARFENQLIEVTLTAGESDTQVMIREQ